MYILQMRIYSFAYMIGLRVYLLLCMAVFLTELILFFPTLVQQHNAGQGRLLLYVSRSHTLTHHSR